VTSGEIHVDGQPAIYDPNQSVGDAVADGVRSDLLRTIVAEGDVEVDEARELAATIEADITDTVNAHFGRGDA
jgi:hypothetical protein